MNLPDADMTSAPDAGDRPDLEGGEAGYAVKLPVFEGPLDLLLHLIRQNEEEIFDDDGGSDLDIE